MTPHSPAALPFLPYCRYVIAHGRVADDTSVIVVDVVESKETKFPDVVARLRNQTQGEGELPSSSSNRGKGGSPSGRNKSGKGGSGGGGGLFSMCFGSGGEEVEEPNSRDSSGPGHLPPTTEVDCLQVGGTGEAGGSTGTACRGSNEGLEGEERQGVARGAFREGEAGSSALSVGGGLSLPILPTPLLQQPVNNAERQ